MDEPDLLVTGLMSTRGHWRQFNANRNPQSGVR